MERGANNGTNIASRQHSSQQISFMRCRRSFPGPEEGHQEQARNGEGPRWSPRAFDAVPDRGDTRLNCGGRCSPNGPVLKGPWLPMTGRSDARLGRPDGPAPARHRGSSRSALPMPSGTRPPDPTCRQSGSRRKNELRGAPGRWRYGARRAPWVTRPAIIAASIALEPRPGRFVTRGPRGERASAARRRPTNTGSEELVSGDAVSIRSELFQADAIFASTGHGAGAARREQGSSPRPFIDTTRQRP